MKVTKRLTKAAAASSSPKIEKYLFHGTKNELTARCICHQNIDPRMHNAYSSHGRGAYFVATSKLAHQFTQYDANADGHFMFMARVLVGRSALGSSTCNRPPPIDAKQPYGVLYDSCVDNVAKPTIYVIFDDHRTYPEFLIEYKTLREL
jgi:poly [ADP-ribose] polymerase 7/11/12/13